MPATLDELFASAGSPADAGRDARRREEASRRLLGASGGWVHPASGTSTLAAHGGSRLLPPPGHVSAVVPNEVEAAYCLELLRRRGVGVDRFVCLGEGAEIGFADVVTRLAATPTTTVLAVVLRDIEDLGEVSGSLADATDHGVAVVVLAAARADERSLGMAVVESFLDRVGAHTVRSVPELIDVLYAFSRTPRFPVDGNLCVITGSGGVGVLMADRAEGEGLHLAEVPPDAQRRLLELCPLSAVRNPVDTTAQIGNNPDLFAEFLRTVLAGGGYDATVNFMSHVGLDKPVIDRRRVPYAAAAAEFPDVVHLVTLLFTPEVQRDFEADGFLVYEEPTDAVASVAALRRHGQRLARRAAAARGAAGPHGGHPPRTVLDTLPDLGATVTGEGGARVAGGVELALHFAPAAAVGATLQLGFSGRSAHLGPHDEVLVAAPGTADEALAAIESLSAVAVFRGVRGRPPLDVMAASKVIAALSEYAARECGGALHLAPLAVLEAGDGVRLPSLSGRP